MHMLVDYEFGQIRASNDLGNTILNKNLEWDGSSLKMSEKSTSQVGISTRNQPKYAAGEKILCFHGALIYEAKVEIRIKFF